jgi:integrase
MSTEKTTETDHTPKSKGRRARGEGAVFFSDKHQRWIWRAVVGHKPNGAVRYKEGRCTTQGAAIQAKKKAEKGNNQPHEDKETVGEHLDYWFDNIAKKKTRPSTSVRYEAIVRLHLKPHIGGTPLRQLTVVQVTKLWASLSDGGMSSGMVKKCSEVLATALESAVSEGKIPVAPTANASKPQVLRDEIEVFTDDEIRSIMKATEGDRFEALYKLAIGTGCREGELLCLESTDFDQAAGTVRIVKTLDERKDGFFLNPPKSKSGTRTVSLPAFAFSAAIQHIEGREPGRMFTTADGNYVSRTNFIRKEWKPLLDRAGVAYRKFHTLRHTHASRLLAAGVDPAEVAKRIGDKIETLMRSYAHWIPTTGRDTAAKVDAIYKEPPEKKPASFRARIKAEVP